MFSFKNAGIHDEEGKKIDVINLLTATHMQQGRFLSFMMKIHPYQDNKNCKHSSMTCCACVKLTLNVDGSYASIDTQILKPPHDLLFQLLPFYYGRKPDIGTLKKERGDIFSECFTESFKEKFLQYINEVLFKMEKSLNDTYIGETTSTALQDEVFICQNIYYDKETRVMVNQSVNDFYNQLLFKIDELPQDVILTLDISTTLFNNFSPDVRELLIWEGV